VLVMIIFKRKKSGLGVARKGENLNWRDGAS